MLVLNLPFKALMFLTLMRPSLVLFLVLWLKLVKDFLKVRCRLALLPFLISCLIWLDLVASLPLIKERILVIILLLHFLSLMLGSVLVLMLPLLVWLTPDLRIKKSLLKCNWTIRKRLPRCKMRLPSGLTPSQLYVFMPPNLGGFFMVRSYYPSECHADYFDFERIEALKPAIEACGISTLSQSPMLGFHKQMDNRIKLLEEILSFRMQGVEFDNGDMYVDGHKAASDVRDEFVSVTEKLMDELAQCYNVLPQLDINNTIDHRPEGDEKWFLENEKTVTQFCRKLAAERPLKDIRDEYNYPKKKGIKDECSRLLEASTMKSRRGFAIQRLMNAMRQAHADGWFIVFDTLTLADDRLEAFYDNPNALRDYFRDIGRMVLAAEGRKANDSHADCYQYFCVPEYGTANGRLHFHAVHFMRTLPTGSVDPNFGRRVRNRR